MIYFESGFEPHCRNILKQRSHLRPLQKKNSVLGSYKNEIAYPAIDPIFIGVIYCDPN